MPWDEKFPLLLLLVILILILILILIFRPHGITITSMITIKKKSRFVISLHLHELPLAHQAAPLTG